MTRRVLVHSAAAQELADAADSTTDGAQDWVKNSSAVSMWPQRTFFTLRKLGLLRTP